ncbi:MAG: hypothetical protein FD137_2430 [Spirochaetes bacterium]|nr:MAG: hypothetical protein FD137_2430 [Spirochaetota bacterium]
MVHLPWFKEMKKAIKIISVLSFILAFMAFMYFFAKMRREALESSLPAAGRLLDFSISNESEGGGSEQKRETVRARIPPEYNEVFLEALDINLDDDLDFEQLVVARPINGDPGGLFLIVVDIIPATGMYYRVWRGSTPVTKATTLAVQTRDLLKDGKLEILCFGIDAENNQSLTVFRRTGKADGSYSTIFSVAGLDVAIVDSLPDETVAIDLSLADPKEESPLDRIRIRYTWNARTERFVPERPQPIPGANIERNLIESIVTGDPKDFEQYLSGLWIRTSGETGLPVHLYFSPQRREILLQDGEVQQRWQWGESTHAYAGLRSPIHNALLSGMQRLLTVDLVGVDRIRVRAAVQQFHQFPIREAWNGIYERVKEKPATSEGSSDRADSSIQGEYSSEAGQRWLFKEGAYTLEDQGYKEEGIYMVKYYGHLKVLDMLRNVPTSATPSQSRKTYVVTEVGPENGDLLVLSPAVN